MAYRLGIDLGTTNTVATVAVDGAPVEMVGLGVNTPQMRSMLYLNGDDRMLVGDSAASRGSADPSRLIIDPRRELGADVPLVVGGREVTAEEATAAVLGFVRDRATAQQGGAPTETVVSYPARWSEYQLECFDRAIAAADLGPVRRCTEAEAAAATYAARNPLADGARIAVYDLGGGSCEVTVLERTPTGVKTVGQAEGAEHPSGADFDEAIFRLVLGGLGDRGRDLKADDPETRARLAEVRRGCTQAKEDLSTESETAVTVSLPGYSTKVRLSRAEFESLVRPAVRESIAMASRVLRGAGVGATDLAAIVLVGGCCRMPIVRDLLQKEFERPPALGTHPEYDVAIGLLLTPQPGGVMSGVAALPVAAGHPADKVPPAPVEAEPVETPAPVVGVPPIVAAAPVVGPATEPTSAPEPTAEPVPAAEPAPTFEEAAPVQEEPPADSTVISAAPIIWTPAVESEQPTEPSAPSPEQTMPDHLIFDYFTPADDTETEQTMPDQRAGGYPPVPVGAGGPPPTLPPWAQASGSVPTGPASAGSGRAATGRPGVRLRGSRESSCPGPTPAATAGAARSVPTRPVPAGQYPPGQYPPGQRPPGQQGQPGGGRRAAPPGYPPGPQTQPYGTRGPGGPGGYPPGPGGNGSGPFGSRRRLILIIVGIVVLVAAAVGVGVLITRPSGEVANPSPSIVVPQASTPATPGTPATPAQTGAPSASPAGTPSGAASPSGTSASSPTTQPLPSAGAIPESIVVVPMRRGGGSDRPLYLVDSEGQINRVKLPTPPGGNSNPMMQNSRNTIIYLNSGVLRVMGTDGSGDRKLFNRDPAGCKHVIHASWSLADPNVMLISCKVSKNKDGFLVVGMDGRLIRRLDAGDQQGDR